MKNKIGIVLLLAFASLGCILIYNLNKKENSYKEQINDEHTENFTIDLIKKSHKNKNYLISPYSIEVALNMLKEGSFGKTKEEIENVLKNRDLNISNENVKIANALFIKNIYKEIIDSEFINILKSKYHSEILYDEFKTPNVINDWAKKNTDDMIEKVIDEIDSNFVLGLANAIAINAKWINNFECNNTTKEKFDKLNSKKIDVEMMHQQISNNAKYLDGNIKGVILPYQENLEFIALLPDKPLEEYINNLTSKNLEKVLNSFKDVSMKTRLNLSLPRFKYEYELKDFMDILISMRISEVFNPNTANLSKIITKENLQKFGKENLYVSDAVHKTYIDLNEKGTKAAAVTFFGIKSNGVIQEDYKIVNIKFNKPFVYMIRDIESKEILFFGSVYEPNIWGGSTCQNIEE